MDLVTHTLAGLVIGRATGPNRRATLATGALAALAPDADILLWPLMGFDAYLEGRGGVTHGLLAVLSGAPLVAAAVSAVSGAAFGRQTVVAALAWLSHLALDAATAHGIAPLAPFSELRVALGWLYPLDLTLIGLLTLPLWVPSVVHAASARPMLMATAGLVIGWIAACGLLHHAATARFHEALADVGAPVERLMVSPAAFLPLWWSGAAWDGEAWRLAALQPHRPAVLGPRHYPNHQHPAARAVLDTAEGGRFLRIAEAPLAEVRCRPDGYAVLLRDLLSADPWSGAAAPPRVFLVDMKHNGLSVREDYWATWLTGRQPPPAVCSDPEAEP